IVPCQNVNAPATGNPNVIIGGVPAGGSIAFCRTTTEVLGVAMRLAADPTQWDAVPRTCEYWIHRLPGDAGIRRYCESTLQVIKGYRTMGEKMAGDELAEERAHKYDDD